VIWQKREIYHFRVLNFLSQMNECARNTAKAQQKDEAYVKSAKTLIQVLTFILSLNAFGHGEDKAGPHGGYVRMPGAFHTELVPTSKTEVRVYLLDLAWKNPSTKDSSVELRSPGFKGTQVTCTPTPEKYFRCQLPKEFRLESKGEISVFSKRESQIGNEAKYELPLKLQAPQSEHGHH
jgi:hypothetical protein